MWELSKKEKQNKRMKQEKMEKKMWELSAYRRRGGGLEGKKRERDFLF